jgi:LAS superfamily LD-carboxypeptidase LdcB
MAGFMRWVHRERAFFSLAVILPVVLGLIFTYASPATEVVSISVKQVELSPSLQCFDTTQYLIYSTRQDQCPPEFLFLGNQELNESATASGTVEEIHPELQKRFKVAQLFAARDGVSLAITSGFRSLDRQDYLFKREVKIRGSETEAAKWVLPANSSNHPKGLAIDVNYPMDPAGAKWLEKNGWRFGLCRVYANEWWHFEGVIAPGGKCPAPAPDARVDLEKDQP